MRLLRPLAFSATLAAAAIVPAPLSAQFTLTPGEWTTFSFNNGSGYPIDGEGFFLQALNALNGLRVRVADAYVAGDAFDIFDGSTLWSTPSVQGPGYLDEYITDDPSLAFGHPQLSWLEFVLAPRAEGYLLTLSVREGAPDAPGGEAFIRFDEVPPETTVPEPASLALMATGLIATGLATRRRRS